MMVNAKSLVFSFFVAGFAFFCIVASNTSYWLNWLGILIYFYAISTWHWTKGESLFSLYTVFFTFFILFSYGQCVMWALGIGTHRGIGSSVLFYGTGIIPDEQDMINVKWYTCICFFVFHLGAMFFSHTRETQKKSWYESDNAAADKAFLRKIGIIIALFVVPLALRVKILEVSIAMRYGYNALYYGEYSTQSGYIQIILYLFFPALICLLIGSDYSPKMVRIVFFIFGIYAILGVMSGDRGGWLYSLIILVWAYVHHKGTFNFRKLINWGILAIIGIYFLSVIKQARDGGGLSELNISDFIDAFSVENSPIVDTFFEMGGSMNIITFFLIKGNGIYPYGNTYLTALLGAISSRILSIIGLKFVLLGDWFSQSYLGLSWGVGFSMIGEAYLNGGYFGGIVYIMILGIVIGKVLAKCSKLQVDQNHPMKEFLALTTANILVGFPRSASYLIVKNFVYGVLVVLFTYYLLRQANRR